MRLDKVDDAGRVTLRYLSRLRHIYVGRAYKRERVRLLVAGDRGRVVAENGQLLRELTLDPSRNYQPQRCIEDTCPQCPATGVLDVLRHDTVSQEGFEPTTKGLRVTWSDNRAEDREIKQMRGNRAPSG